MSQVRIGRTSTQARIVLAGVAVVCLGCSLAAFPSSARATVVPFPGTGAEQTFVVPAGVASVHVVAVGGKGGGGNPNSIPGSGGPGGVASGDLAVAADETLYVEVGGNGSDASNAGSGAPGFNGGGSPAAATAGAGGGGGASDVRTVPRASGAAASLASRLVVAGGGGGAGEVGGLSGGAGGGATGSPGAPASCGGHGGMANAGGSAGTGMGGATAGQLGTGGTGGHATFSSGPGGGGLYGGGGGGDDCGGGGGSGGFGPGTSNGSFGVDSTGVPSVTISYVVPPTVVLASPVDGGVYAQFGIVYAGYACTAGAGTVVSSCSASAANATPVDTATPGLHTFTVTATDADGGTTTRSVTYTVTAAHNPSGGSPPAITHASVSHKRFRIARGATAISAAAAPLGTSFRFTLSARARLQITITHPAPGLRSGRRCVAPSPRLRRAHAKSCTRDVTTGRLKRAGEPSGADSVPFTGRIGTRALTPGAYHAVLVATDAGGSSRPVTLAFAVVR